MSQAFRKLTSSISQKTFFFYWRSISKKHGGNTISAEERSIYKVIPFLKDDVTRQKEKIISWLNSEFLSSRKEVVQNRFLNKNYSRKTWSMIWISNHLITRHDQNENIGSRILEPLYQ